MNMTIDSFLKPGTGLREIATGATIMLFSVAGTAGLMGWLFALVA